MNIAANTKAMPRGSEFLEIAARVETQCSEVSLIEIPRLGLSTPACYEFLGDVLSMLYEEASCFHGCAGGDHFFQRLTARVVTNSLSSLRLAILGYYDESLALTRNLGEIANLLFLFAAKPDSLEAWQLADEKKRKSEFSPVKVRLKLEEMNLRPPIDQSRYGLLCDVGVHLGPSVSPQTFNEQDRHFDSKTLAPASATGEHELPMGQGRLLPSAPITGTATVVSNSKDMKFFAREGVDERVGKALHEVAAAATTAPW